MNKQTKVNLLRIVHALFAVYFILCIAYIFYAAIVLSIGLLLAIAIGSLAIEGIAVFILNNGNCPLYHLQNKLGDTTPFFELFLSSRLAKKAVPFFSILSLVGILLLLLRVIIK